ncbi:MAG TPA: hypothetical protein VG916_01780 [Gemmatimonadaceae bacterium]|nr:hypothetical protein [Gemmatimonadaceae bacterium]
MRIVIADANVLINLAVAGLVRLLGSLPGYEFCVAEDALDEVTQESQRAEVDSAIEQGHLQVVRLDSADGVAQFAVLRRVMGRGEAACIALANENGWIIASDERRVFRREAIRIVGEDRIMTTVDLFLESIRAGALTVGQADAAKTTLAANRFAVKFNSFQDLL